jgi:hypothetical protein
VTFEVKRVLKELAVVYFTNSSHGIRFERLEKTKKNPVQSRMLLILSFY